MLARNRELQRQLEELVEPVVNRLGFALVDLACGRRGRDTHVRLTIDGPDGVTVDDCEAVSRQVEAALDASRLVGDDYLLEVESPGLDRVLRSDRELRYFVGRAVEVSTLAPVNGTRRLVGRLAGVDDDALFVDVNGEEHCLPRSQVARVRLHVEW